MITASRYDTTHQTLICRSFFHSLKGKLSVSLISSVFNPADSKRFSFALQTISMNQLFDEFELNDHAAKVNVKT